MKGLILKPHWADLILSGEKTIEIRGNNTKIRGTIGIIKSKSGSVFGTVDLYDSIFLTKELYEGLREIHKVGISYEELLKIYPKPYGWCFRNAFKYDKPLKYNHKRGCVIWVNL